MQFASGLSLALSTSKRCLRICGGPRRVRQTAGHVAARFEECRDRRSIRIVRKAIGLRLERHAAATASEGRAGVAARSGSASGGGRCRWGRCRWSSSRRSCGSAGSRTLTTASTPTPPLIRWTAVGAHPHAGKIDLAVGRARRRCIFPHVALRVPRHARVANLPPLRGDGHGTDHHHAGHHPVNCLGHLEPLTLSLSPGRTTWQRAYAG